MPAEIDVAIIGAGVIGLATAHEITQGGKEVFVFEKNSTFGLETSSRNSEVIHAGIYYPEDSLKAKLCVEGKNLLYSFCDKHNIAYNKCGKIIVAADENEITQLEKLCDQGRRNGVDDLVLLARTELKKLEPNIQARAGLLSPSSGIFDSHNLLKFLYSQAREKGTEFVFDAAVIGIERAGAKYKVRIKDRDGTSAFIAHIVVNCAGLNSDRIAQLAGIDIVEAGYQLHYCKGEYFSLNSKYRNIVGKLIYPTPDQAGHGIHWRQALDGRVLLGPSAHYVQVIDYAVDETHKQYFYDSAKKFVPFVALEDLAPESAGIRPKLQGPGESFRDFVIAHEEKAGFPSLINLVGIESPGLTAALAIARYVGKMMS
ncbi:MAG: NAD(P)/FAD-dependent oxidoreductase [Dehalococcoidia bacterium]|nr:NAD(P)/FAD-dependent oxidoreductase [Dehalococcoidia bacterium]MDH4366905.1 NAD(P)/FAD-dependent oxidoreductase [Dehalococcoidia bacterium]